MITVQLLYIGKEMSLKGCELMETSHHLTEVQVEPHKKQLHVTLAYNFPSSHLASLEKLARGIEVKLSCDWLAVLFSRDIRFANHEVFFYGE